ncbi:MAG TPA: hypothetical protein VGQ20_04310, partial [Acidimicrobiales bacterium]|nr:hypothetical protein [Acidimicrobiales bacterium]
MRVSLPHRVGTLLCGLGLVAALASAALPASATDEATATLKPAHVGATNPGFTEGDCPSAGWGWHFVLSGNFTDFVSVTATFLVDGQTEVVNAPDAATNSIVYDKHAYLFTSGPGVLQSATATVVLNDAGVEQEQTIDTE